MKSMIGNEMKELMKFMGKLLFYPPFFRSSRLFIGQDFHLFRMRHMDTKASDSSYIHIGSWLQFMKTSL